MYESPSQLPWCTYSQYFIFVYKIFCKQMFFHVTLNYVNYSSLHIKRLKKATNIYFAYKQTLLFSRNNVTPNM